MVTERALPLAVSDTQLAPTQKFTTLSKGVAVVEVPAQQRTVWPLVPVYVTVTAPFCGFESDTDHGLSPSWVNKDEGAEVVKPDDPRAAL